VALTQLRLVLRSFPPGRRFGFGTAGKSYLHMYQAHIAAYEAIKASDGVRAGCWRVNALLSECSM
jgi:hypothetical protein